MAIKPRHTLTKRDFEQALVTQRLSVSEVARETGIPRHIVSHFRNYGDGMKPEQLAKLRDYLEGLGVEFTDEQPEAAASQPATPQGLRLPAILSDDGLTQRTALICRHFFIDERLTDDQLKEAGERIEECFLQAKELMEVELGREWLSDNFNETTKTKLRELWGHLARIGLVSLHLQGRILINQDRILANSLPEEDRSEPKTFGDLLADSYREAVAGLSAYEHQERAETENDEVPA